MLYSWGRSEDGQCGNGDTADQDVPVVIDVLREKRVVLAACGSGHTVVLTDEGEVWSWGRGDDGRLGHADCTWKYVPKLVHALQGRQVIQITCGSYHTAAVTDTGALYTWGGGMYGKLGLGTEIGHTSPVRVDALALKRVTMVACGSRHTAALISTGEVYAWGDRENGVCGVGETEGHQFLPRLIDTLKDKVVTQIAACGFHTGAITSNGELYTWGEGKFGRLGHGTERNSAVPRVVDTLLGRRIKLISCGGFHSACVTEDNVVYTFGGGEHGQLGHGDKVNKLSPHLVAELVGKGCVQVTCGWSHSVALTEDGKLYTWGNGDHGKLGHGDRMITTFPRMVESLAPIRVVKVASYNEHTVAICKTEDPVATAVLTAEFLSDLRGLVNNEQYSDFVLVVEGRKIHAHRAILSQRSAHFRAMFNSGMRESRAAEIEIPCIGYETFLALIEFLYCDTPRDDVTPDMAIELYCASDMYGIERLKTICLGLVAKGLRVDNAATLFQQAEDQHAGPIKDLAIKYIVRNFDQVSKTDAFAALCRESILEVLRARNA